jgi:hypothetical protein
MLTDHFYLASILLIGLDGFKTALAGVFFAHTLVALWRIMSIFHHSSLMPHVPNLFLEG